MNDSFLFLIWKQREITAIQEKTGIDLENALLTLDEAEKEKNKVEGYVV